MNHVGVEKLVEFEALLNNFKYRNIAIGSLMAPHLNLDFLSFKYNFSNKSALLDIARSIRLKFNLRVNKNSNAIANTEFSIEKGLPLLTFMSARRHLFNMNYSVFKIMNKEVFCFIQNSLVLDKFETKPKNYLYFSQVPPYDLRLWRTEIESVWSEMRPVVKIFLKKSNIPRSYLYRLKYNLLEETKTIRSFEILLDRVKPVYILTEADRHSFNVGLVCTAKAKNISTYTIMHGIVGQAYGYVPILSDKLFGWGSRQKESLTNFGADSARIEITGAPQLTNKIGVSKTAAREKFGILPDQRVVVLSTNPNREDLKIKLYTLFNLAIASLKNQNVIGFIKIHPSEQVSFYNNLQKADNLFVPTSDEFSFDESLALADLVCNYNSAYGIDAVIREKAVIIINVETTFLGEMADLVKIGDLPVVSQVDELSQQIESYLMDESFRMGIDKKTKEYAKKYCIAVSDTAAKNVLSKIEYDIIKTSGVPKKIMN